MRHTKDSIQEAIAKSFSWAGVCRQLGLKPNSGSQSHIKSRALLFDIPFTHFTGQGHNKGNTREKTNAIEYCIRGIRTSSDRLRRRLIRDGYKKEECERCGITEWLGERVPLELDHIDSDNTNNEIQNLQIICPNCHALATNSRRKR
jgi:5-methylcytosine-specific restriction endonuclease McrA